MYPIDFEFNLTNPSNPPRPYKMGVAYFNMMFSEQGVGFRPLLIESNPIICETMYENNLIIELNIYNHMLSKRKSHKESI